MSDALDIDERQLCADGACIGVIGDDGRCKVCGKGGASVSASSPSPSPSPSTDHNGASASAAADSDIDDRQLCADGACIGVIGADGKCKVCGQPAA